MKKNKKVIALVLSLMLVIALIPLSAYASQIQTTNSLTPGSDIDSLTLSESSYTCTRTDEPYVAMGYNNTRYTYNITLPATTADNATITITFVPTSGTGTVVSPMAAGGPIQYFASMINNAATNTYTVTLNNGTGSKTTYVHHGLNSNPTVYGKYDTYIFNFEKGYPVSISTGDTVYIEWDTSNTTTGTVTPRVANTPLPADFTLWVDNPGNNYQITQTYTPDEQSPVTDTISSAYHDGTNYAYSVPFKTVSSTLTVISGSTTYTILLDGRSNEQGAAQGTAPSAIVSYTPIGQFATGSGWGTINKGTAQNPVYKFVGASGLESTGVSLGALGGYIEFYFANGIQDNVSNPYGVDFVIYGNAFDGNPEPGAVQVSENGTVWYELAGSKYYYGDFTYNSSHSSPFSNVYSGSLRNADVYYSINNGNIDVELKDGSGSTKITKQQFTAGTGWWPMTSEGYQMGQTYTDWNSVVHNAPTPHTDTNVTVSHSNTALTFGGVTAIQDSNTNSDYAFGYADVTPNGSPANYGAPVNPYASNSGGGDGFDLAWAVDIETGQPVGVTGKTFHYVRVYSAVLDNATFGETSAEVCGIFTTYGSSGQNTVTPYATVMKNGTGIAKTIAHNKSYAQSYQTVSVSTTDVISVTSGADYVYINGVLVTATEADPYTFSPNLGTNEKMQVQFITQTGTMSAYVRVIEFVGQ